MTWERRACGHCGGEGATVAEKGKRQISPQGSELTGNKSPQQLAWKARGLETMQGHKIYPRASLGNACLLFPPLSGVFHEQV